MSFIDWDSLALLEEHIELKNARNSRTALFLDPKNMGNCLPKKILRIEENMKNLCLKFDSKNLGSFINPILFSFFREFSAETNRSNASFDRRK